MTEDGEIDTAVLKKFDPAISQLNGIIKEMLTLRAPRSISTLHLEVINGLEIMAENLTDMKLVNSDTLVAFSAMNQYMNNMTKAQESLNILRSTISQKLKD